MGDSYEELPDQRLSIRGHVRPTLIVKCPLAGEHRLCNACIIELARRIERMVPGEQDVHDDTKRPHVDSLVVRAAAQHLRCHVRHSAVAALDDLVDAKVVRHPKVDQLHVRVGR